MRNRDLAMTLQTPTTGTCRKMSYGEEQAINIRIAIKEKLDASLQSKYSRLFVSTGLDCTNLRCGFCYGFPFRFPKNAMLFMRGDLIHAGAYSQLCRAHLEFWLKAAAG